MKNKTIVIADDNRDLVEELTQFFKFDPEFEVIGIAYDGLEAVSEIVTKTPDYVLLDVVMPELDGYGVLQALSKERLSKLPKIMMISQLYGDNFINKAIRYGASYYMAKPLNFSNLRDMLNGLDDTEETMHIVATKTNHHDRSNGLDERLSNIFISVGIPAHIKGYQFLREAIKIAVATPEIINSITKKLYPSIAAIYDTSPSKVERAIRHAIEVAWNRGKIENINAIFGIKIYSANDKPTNGEFIALVADKMLLEGA